jgi:hypothetical protein
MRSAVRSVDHDGQQQIIHVNLQAGTMEANGELDLHLGRFHKDSIL